MLRRFLTPLLLLGVASIGLAQNQPTLTPQEQSIRERLGKLRSLPDDEWTKSVGQLAAEIHSLPADAGKMSLAGSLSSLATEGDAGQQALQTLADTMVDLTNDAPANRRAGFCGTLAALARYEHVKVSLDLPEYKAALAKLEAEDRTREDANFTLTDLAGKQWTLKDLRGKVVLVNFWATWCPPCRREMPDMQALSEKFGPRGLVILAISDEEVAKVQPFIADKKYTYPILLDTGRTVNTLFGVQGIPKSFVYNREGKLAAVAIDRRTNRQFLAMLKQAGLE